MPKDPQDKPYRKRVQEAQERLVREGRMLSDGTILCPKLQEVFDVLEKISAAERLVNEVAAERLLREVADQASPPPEQSGTP